MPYAVFRETNEALKMARSQISELSPLSDRVTDLQQQLEIAQSTKETQVALALAGASQQYLGYLTTRYLGIEGDKPAAGEWATGLRAEEPAFFGASKQTQTQQTTTTPPGPSAGVTGTGSSPAPPITDDLIRTMSNAEYTARRSEILEFMKAKRG